MLIADNDILYWINGSGVFASVLGVVLVRCSLRPLEARGFPLHLYNFASGLTSIPSSTPAPGYTDVEHVSTELTVEASALFATQGINGQEIFTMPLSTDVSNVRLSHNVRSYSSGPP